MGDDAEAACHELLLRLAGRLPDRQLWRYRDWLAADGLPELGHTLPLTLLRERIGLTAAELRLVDVALRPHGADQSLLSCLRELDEPPELAHTFSVDGPAPAGLGDPLAVLLGAVLRHRPTVGEVRGTWRRPVGGGPATRVLVVTATAGCAALAGELQRIQRALGETDPCVEVLAADTVPPPYHQAAVAASELLCTGAALVRQLVRT